MLCGKWKEMLSWSLLAIWFVNLDSWSDSIAIEMQLPAQLPVPSIHLHSSCENDFSFLYFFAFVVLQMVWQKRRERERENLGKGLLRPVTIIHCDLTFWIFSPAQPSTTPHVTVTSRYCN